MWKQINEISTTRLLKHFSDDSTLAVISTYRTERSESENMKLLKQFKTEVRSELKLGFTEFVSKWVEENPETKEMIASDERSLAIYGISKEDAMNYGAKFQQSSIIFKDDTGCREICTTDFVDYEGKTFKVGDIVRDFHVDSDKPFNLDDAEAIFSKRKGGPASKPVKGTRAFRLNEVYEVEPVRSATFATHERWLPLVQNPKNESTGKRTVNETSLNRLLGKHTESGYAIVSACRGDWNEDELKNRQMNNIKTDEIKKDIYDSGFQYIPVQGGFHEKNSEDETVEDSFIIVNYKRGEKEAADINELKELAIDLCGKYNQDSVLVVEPGKNPTYYKRDGSVDFELGKSVSVRDTAQEYFTRLGGGREFTFLSEAQQPATINGLRSRRMKGEICEMYGYDRRHPMK